MTEEKVKTWDDFIALFAGLIDELEKLDKALERMRIAFKSLSKTYEEMLK